MKTINVTLMKLELKTRYDYISKLDSIKHLKKVYGDTVSIEECVMAWELAFDV